MNRWPVFIFPISIILCVVIWVGFYIPGVRHMNVIVSGKTFDVEIADTPALQEKGLSGHAPLKDNQGMIFLFDRPDRYGFWMQNMQYPIDIIWISETGTVVYMKESLSPDTFPKVFYPDTPAQYVLEISAGHIENMKIQIGDVVRIIKK